MPAGWSRPSAEHRAAAPDRGGSARALHRLRHGGDQPRHRRARGCGCRSAGVDAGEPRSRAALSSITGSGDRSGCGAPSRLRRDRPVAVPTTCARRGCGARPRRGRWLTAGRGARARHHVVCDVPAERLTGQVACGRRERSPPVAVLAVRRAGGVRRRAVLLGCVRAGRRDGPTPLWVITATGGRVCCRMAPVQSRRGEVLPAHLAVDRSMTSSERAQGSAPTSVDGPSGPGFDRWLRRAGRARPFAARPLSPSRSRGSVPRPWPAPR